jgi:hypothetical protein
MLDKFFGYPALEFAVSEGIKGTIAPVVRKGSTLGCPASSILSGQRQLDFPMLFERYQQQSGLWEKWESRGFCGISKGGGKGGKPAFGFPRFPRPGFFHSPLAAAFLLLKKSSMFTLLLRTPSQHPDSSWLVPCGNSGCSVPGLRNDGRDDRSRPRWSSRL